MGLFDTIMGRNNQPVAHASGHSVQGTNQQTAPQPNPNDRIQQNNPNADPNNLPPNGNAQPNVDPVISQLDQFKDIWNTPAPDPTKVDPLTQPLLTYDPAKFAAEARKMNFTAGINPELVTKALGGDAQALMDVINHSTQNAFTAASQLSTNLVEGATKTNNSRLEPKMAERFKEFMLQQQRTDDPVMQHAAVAPMLDLAKRQLLSKHPEKSAAEIHQMAEQYVTDFARVFTEDKQRKVAPGSNGNFDPFDFSSFEQP